LSTYGDSREEIFFFFFNFSKPQYMPILVDLGGGGGRGEGFQVGKAPKKALLLPKSYKFLFHFGDELNYASLTIDY
jgi:hypothetical protein